MKKTASLFLTFILVFCMLFALPLGVSAAATGAQDGLEVTITTNKDEYTADEDIQISVSIRNTNDQKVEDVSIETLLPEDLAVKTGNLCAADIDIEAGATYIISGVAQLKDNEATQPTEATEPATQPATEPTPGSPDTGDEFSILLWAVLLVAAAAGMVWMIKSKKAFRMMCLLLCLAMVVSMLPMGAWATESNTAITVDKAIAVDGKVYTIQVNVKHEGRPAVASAVQIDRTVFAFDEETSKYSIHQNTNEISGTLENAANATALRFEVTDSQGATVDTGAIAVAANWTTDEIGFIVGTNTLTVTATFKDGKTASDTVILECYFNSAIEKLTIDVETDTDGDGLVNYLENHAGSDISKTDTDGDRLTDYQEVVLVGTDPCKVDSDGDGISDYDSDYDKDGLTNGYELSINTNPILSDTDNDLLADNDELSKYHTDPTKDDTDNDGAKDGWELDNGFDPLVYNENFTVEVDSGEVSEYNQVCASVVANIDGEQVESLNVEPIDYSDNALLSSGIPGYLGTAYDFSVDGEIDSATLIFDYDTALGSVSPEFQPRIYYFNEQTQELEELPNQTVENGKVSVKVEHFSTYILLNKVEFDKVWEEEIRPPVGDNTGSANSDLDMLLLIDCSGSMGPQGANNDPQNIRLDVSKKLVEKTGENDRVAVASFGERTTLLADFISDKNSLYTAIDKVGNTDYETRINDALNRGFELFDNSSRENAVKYIILLTDGGSTDTVSGYTDKATQRDIVIFTVGLGHSVDERLLKDIAESTGGKYYHATKADDLYEIYDELEEETVDYTTDSNNDGISDYFTKLICEGKLRLSTGSDEFFGIDFNYNAEGELSADYDNDGLKNGEELIVTYNETTGRVSAKMVSDPMMKHSDGDGIDDYAESKAGTDPLRVQYSKYYTDWLKNDDNYYYEDYVAMYDDSTLYQLDSAFLATIFGVWNTEELYRDILADYFLDYVDPIGEVQEQEERATFVDIADDFLSGISNITDIAKDINFYKGLVGDIKHLIDVANGYTTTIEAISVQYIKIVQQVTVYYPDAGIAIVSTRTMSSTTVSVLTKNSPLKTGKISGVSLAFDVVGGVIDMADTISTLAAVNANTRVFEENLDFLIEMRDYGLRQNIRNAAQTVINAMGEGYGTAMADALLQDAGELTVNVLITVASANPYVKAVTFVRDLIDKITGISKVLRIEYQMLAYNCMSYSAKQLISRDTELYKGYYYSRTGNLERYLTHLAQIRILGERKYDEFYSTGANKWFNDEEEIHRWIEKSVANIKTCADALGLTLKTK